MPEIDREPPYLKVAHVIAKRIEDGDLRDGDIIPSTRAIADDWKISRATAGKVIATLTNWGLVIGKPGLGTIVKNQRAYRSAKDRVLSVLRTGRIYPEGHFAKIRGIHVVPAPVHVAQALGVAPGADVIRRQRTTYTADEQPWSTSISWFDGALAGMAPLLLQEVRILQGTTRYIEEQTGRKLGPHQIIRVSAGAASAEEAAELGIGAGSPVLRGRNFNRDTEGKMIEYGESVAPQGVETEFEFYTNDEDE